jgi:hypothetical protein
MVVLSNLIAVHSLLCIIHLMSLRPPIYCHAQSFNDSISSARNQWLSYAGLRLASVEACEQLCKWIMAIEELRRDFKHGAIRREQVRTGCVRGYCMKILQSTCSTTRLGKLLFIDHTTRTTPPTPYGYHPNVSIIRLFRLKFSIRSAEITPGSPTSRLTIAT